MLEKLKQYLKSKREQHFLKRHLCDTWEQYYHRYDPGISYQSTRIKDFYHGYPFVHCIETANHYAYQLLYDYGPGGHKYGYEEILEWCKQNGRAARRIDMHRVIKDTWSGSWEINEIGGVDYIFFAFKDRRDYSLFMLRWA